MRCHKHASSNDENSKARVTQTFHDAGADCLNVVDLTVVQFRLPLVDAIDRLVERATSALPVTGGVLLYRLTDRWQHRKPGKFENVFERFHRLRSQRFVLDQSQSVWIQVKQLLKGRQIAGDVIAQPGRIDAIRLQSAPVHQVVSRVHNGSRISDQVDDLQIWKFLQQSASQVQLQTNRLDRNQRKSLARRSQKGRLTASVAVRTLKAGRPHLQVASDHVLSVPFHFVDVISIAVTENIVKPIYNKFNSRIK